MITKYRVHITCPAKHTTYRDYCVKKTALAQLHIMSDRNTWYATHIEKVRVKDWRDEKVNQNVV